MTSTAPVRTVRAARLAVVVNPSTRHGESAQALAALSRAMPAAELTIVRTGQLTQARTKLHQAITGGVDGVIAIGGDGTVAVAVQLLAGTTMPLGIMPTGSGNDIARALSIPLDEPAAGAAAIAGGAVRAIDLLEVRSADGKTSLCTSVLTTGFDALVNDRASRLRWPRGPRRYWLAVLIEFVRLRQIPYAVTWIDEHGEAGSLVAPLLMATAANMPWYGGGIEISPESDPADGVAELVVIRPAGRIRLSRVLAATFKGKHLAADEVRVIRVRHASITADPDMRGSGDGEDVGALPLTIRVLPGALRVFTSAPEAGQAHLQQ